MGSIDWPRPPIQPEDLPKIRALLAAEEYERLLKRIEAAQQPNTSSRT